MKKENTQKIILWGLIAKIILWGLIAVLAVISAIGKQCPVGQLMLTSIAIGRIDALVK